MGASTNTMNTMTSKELRQEFKKQWPNLKQIWLRNKEYVIPTYQELERILSYHTCLLPVTQGFNECENFALYLHAFVKKRIVQEGVEKLNWAFGDFICRYHDIFGTITHTACICLTDRGFYFIEPMQKNKIVQVNDDYEPFFINLM